MYSIGDKVVHPMHGAGVVENIKEMWIGGVKRNYYVISFAVGSMVSDIPVESCEKIGIRGVITKDEGKRIIEHFRASEVGSDINWNKRQRENIEKIKSGDLYVVASVLKELMCRERRKGLSTSERKTLCSARQIVISELILSGVARQNDIELMLDETVSEFLNANKAR